MKYADGNIVLDKLSELDAVDSALILAHQFEGNTDPNTGRFLKVSPLLRRLALTRTIGFDVNDKIQNDIAILNDDIRRRAQPDSQLRERAVEIENRVNNIGDTPIDVTLSSDEIPETIDALRQTITAYQALTNTTNQNVITFDDDAVLKHGETAMKLFALITA